jgi:hypothetical protein
LNVECANGMLGVVAWFVVAQLWMTKHALSDPPLTTALAYSRSALLRHRSSSAHVCNMPAALGSLVLDSHEKLTKLTLVISKA